MFKNNEIIVSKEGYLLDSYSRWETNKNEIVGRSYTTSHWGHFDKDNKWHNATIFVPRICFSCYHFEYGERGDYGELLSLPYCEKNVWFPVKSNRCKKADLNWWLYAFTGLDEA